jgi:hypothetical protein
MRKNQHRLPLDDGLGLAQEHELSLTHESLLVGGIRH